MQTSNKHEDIKRERVKICFQIIMPKMADLFFLLTEPQVFFCSLFSPFIQLHINKVFF